MAGTPKKKKPLTEKDLLKLEIINEIGLDVRLAEVGWDGLPAADCGRVGGLLAYRLRQIKNEAKG